MSKIICDICGTQYDDSVGSCPVCGWDQKGDLPISVILTAIFWTIFRRIFRFPALHL